MRIDVFKVVKSSRDLNIQDYDNDLCSLFIEQQVNDSIESPQFYLSHFTKGERFDQDGEVMLEGRKQHLYCLGTLSLPVKSIEEVDNSQYYRNVRSVLFDSNRNRLFTPCGTACTEMHLHECLVLALVWTSL